jgi:hypothetical protein
VLCNDVHFQPHIWRVYIYGLRMCVDGYLFDFSKENVSVSYSLLSMMNCERCEMGEKGCCNTQRNMPCGSGKYLENPTVIY